MNEPLIMQPPKRSQYGECDGCHRLVAIAQVLGHLPNGEAYGYCESCRDGREKPAR